ncbi:MAG TPA: hypothetical protein VER14_00735 [Phototrophicaceae bacterium]|nr:hypothetical protein [Phototrophicaceae bacterium]
MTNLSLGTVILNSIGSVTGLSVIVGGSMEKSDSWCVYYSTHGSTSNLTVFLGPKNFIVNVFEIVLKFAITVLHK